MDYIVVSVVIFIIGALIILINNGQKNILMQKYVHYSFTHTAFKWGALPVLPWFARNRQTKSWAVMFTPKSFYDHNSDDNHDWNKGGGTSFDLMSNHIDSLMWAWRINQKNRTVELAAYHHINGQRVVAKINGSEVLLSLPLDKESMVNISYRIDYNNKQYIWAFSSDDNVVNCFVPFSHDKTPKKSIAPYFGGNKKPSNKLSLYIDTF